MSTGPVGSDALMFHPRPEPRSKSCLTRTGPCSFAPPSHHRYPAVGRADTSGGRPPRTTALDKHCGAGPIAEALGGSKRAGGACEAGAQSVATRTWSMG